jgi:heptosyltransferase III
MTTPIVAALHARRPDLRVTVAVEPAFAAVLEGHPAVDEILPVRGALETARAIRARKFSLVYNQHGGPTSAFYAALSGAPLRVCWDNCQYSFLYNVRVPGSAIFYGPRKVHTIEHRLTQLYWTGLERGPAPPPRVFPQPEALATVAGKLAQRGLSDGQPYAVLHPGAGTFTKQWPLANFAAIARWLREEHDIFPVVRLGPGDRAIADMARQRFVPHSIVFEAESLDLREVIALIAGARLFVGNDSGPAHLATATGRPSVVIFGSTDSATWRPWKTEHRVVQNDFPCNPCKADRCYAFTEPLCILSVTEDQVRESCAALLTADRRPTRSVPRRVGAS